MIRSMLFLPGNSPNMLVNGDILGADAVIFDLEDAVSPDEKDAARILVRHALQEIDYSHVQTIIRINSIDETNYWRKDLEEIVPLCPSMIMPPKVSNGKYVHMIAEHIRLIERKNGIPKGTVKILPLIETAIGIENAFEIANSDSAVAGIFLGAEDLTADLRCERTKQGDEIFYARSRMVMAGRAAGVEIYDTPFVDVYDDEGFMKDVAFSKALGFSGKASISPRHVAGINETFTPKKEEIDYAKEVLEAIEEAKSQGKGAIALYGKMIDAPIVARAKRVLEMAETIFGGLHHE